MADPLQYLRGPPGGRGPPVEDLCSTGTTTNCDCLSNSLEEEFKVTRAREVVQYRDSSDPKVAKAGIQVRTGRKWRAEEAVQEADARLRHRSLVGVVTRGRAGLGSFPTPQMNTRGKEGRRLVQEEVRAAVEETRTVGSGNEATGSLDEVGECG